MNAPNLADRVTAHITAKNGGIRPPDDVGSLSKLNEWLSECGLLQREARFAAEGGVDFPQGPNGTTILNPEMRFREGGGNEAWRTLFRIAASVLYGHAADAAKEGKRLVWRNRPEGAEQAVMRYTTDQGEVIDPVTYRGDAVALTATDTGGRVAQFYCRFWLEDV